MCKSLMKCKSMSIFSSIASKRVAAVLSGTLTKEYSLVCYSVLNHHLATDLMNQKWSMGNYASTRNRNMH